MKYKAKLYTYYTYTRQDHTVEGVTLQHFMILCCPGQTHS